MIRRARTQIVYPRATASPPAQAGSTRAARADPGKEATEWMVEQIVVRDLAEWDLLAVDTWLNETQRRLLTH